MDSKINVVNLNKKKIENKTKTQKNFSIKNIFKSFLSNKNEDLNEVKQKNTMQELSENDEKCKKTNNKEKTNGNFFKILKNKQFKAVIVVLIFGVIALIILNSSFGTSLTSTASSGNSNVYMSGLEYCEKLENKLVGVLSKISGAGDVKVMVTVENGPELKLASNTDERTNTTTNGSNSTTNVTKSTEPIIVKTSNNSTPLVLSELSPKVTGIVVVASGAKDIKVRLNLLEAVKALLNVSNNNIQIYY